MDYEDYDQVSKNYDSSEDICQIMNWIISSTGRQAVGVDAILGAIAHVMKGKSTKEASIIDIGQTFKWWLQAQTMQKDVLQFLCQSCMHALKL